MKTTSLKNILTGATMGIALTAVLAGCGTTPAATQTADGAGETPIAQASQAAGTLLLSVNPEIEIEYDDDGLVTEVEGVNDEGRGVTSGYGGYEGRQCREVVSDLVGEIYEAGHFNQTVDGHDRNVVVKLQQGSSYPGEGFLRGIEDDVRATVGGFGLASDALTVAPEQLDDRGYIGLDAAKDIVLSQLGLTEASFNDHEYELDDGVYEMEFTSGGVEYEYEVDARTGKTGMTGTRTATTAMTTGTTRMTPATTTATTAMTTGTTRMTWMMWMTPTITTTTTATTWMTATTIGTTTATTTSPSLSSPATPSSWAGSFCVAPCGGISVQKQSCSEKSPAYIDSEI